MICLIITRRKLGSPQETTSDIYDIPNFPIYDTPDNNTGDLSKAITLELKENVAYEETRH